MYGKFVKSEKGKSINCGVVEGVKRSTLNWLGDLERMNSDEVESVYESEIRGQL